VRIALEHPLQEFFVDDHDGNVARDVDLAIDQLDLFSGFDLFGFVRELLVVFETFSGGPRAGAALLISLVYRVLVAALFVRVIAGWLGYHRYTRLLRPAYVLTDWVVEPVRRVLPPLGRFDWSPLAAWLVLMLLRQILLLGLRV
jgi:YggT family protein